MQTIAPKRRQLDFAQYVRRPAQEGDYTTLIAEPTMLMEGDTPLVVYDELGRDLDSAPLTAALNRVKFDVSDRSSNLPTSSKTLGFQPRNTVRRDFCTTAALAREHPVAHALLVEFAARAHAHYLRHNPSLAARHAALVEGKVRGDFVLPGTPFTSGIVNKDNPLLYHFDGGNDKDVWSVMFVFKRRIQGGYLAVPEFDVAFELKHNSIFMFDGQQILHGVTPFVKLTKDAFRYSIVYYSRREMWNCLPLDEEVARIRAVRTARERAPRTRERIAK